jgi:hypothetical protein
LIKIIVSHDVDHITAWEHSNDLIVPKFIVRSLIEAGLGYSSLSEFAKRSGSIIYNKWHNIESMMEFDRQRKVPSTFFIAVNKGRQLSYSLRSGAYWIEKIQQEGFDVGVHGIVFDDYAGVQKEYLLFKEYAGTDGCGIRFHDIGVRSCDAKLTHENLEMLSRTGYLFSSNTFEFSNPHKVAGLWEFPIQLMDGYLFRKNRGWQNRSLQQAQQETEDLIKKAIQKGIQYFNVISHDFYFSDNFRTSKEWYRWFIDYCLERGFRFVSYREAVLELESR